VGRKLPGWRLARTTEDNLFAWRDDDKKTSAWLADYATALARCARDYRHTDQVTSDSLAAFPDVE
jgi:hypothetical protein